MKRSFFWRTVATGLALGLLITACGCDMRFGNWSQAKYERTSGHQAPLSAGGTLDVSTDSGSISITGDEVTECRVEATIVAHAPTEEEAQELAEQVQIRLDAADDTMKIRADKPRLTNNRSIAVSYVITAPRQVNVLCESDYGSLSVTGLTGTVKGRTSSGSVTARRIEGPADLHTSYGSISCEDLAGPTTWLRSSSGSISVIDLKGSAKIDTSYGSVSCERAAGESLDLKTSSGRIALTDVSFPECMAETSYGSIVCRTFTGKAIKLRSSSGSVELAGVRADTVDLHTSYGRVEAREITTGDLLANSGSGSIEVACSASCPADLKAHVKTSYGSIGFVAPAQFSGEVRLTTSYGSVQTALPVQVTGRIEKNNLTGRIGEGTGLIHLESGSGSVELK
jgi:DUF4097 and DUF4098 domain-containing protein YvlB